MSTIYTKEVLEEAVSHSESYAGVLRYLNKPQAGGTQAYIGKKIKEFGLDTSHFTGRAWNRGKQLPHLRKKASDILVLLPHGSMRPKRRTLYRAMVESGIEYRCSGADCQQPEPVWAGKPLTIEIDHVNGNWLDNRLNNLRFLCPNCHSQQVSSNKPHKHRNATLVPRPPKEPKKAKLCSCGVEISRRATTCRSCVPKKSKIDWPSNEELIERLKKSNYSKLSLELGVSDNAIRKRLARK